MITMHTVRKITSVLVFAAFCLIPQAAQAQTGRSYVITGDAAGGFTALRVSPAGQAGSGSIQEVINAVRSECFDGCSIQFGENGELLDIGNGSISFDLVNAGTFTWGQITLMGGITSSSNLGTINIALTAETGVTSHVIDINADIANTNSGGRAISHTSTRPVNITGGNITSAINSSGNGTIHLAGNSLLNITGAAVQNTGSGRAVYNSGAASVTISGGAQISAGANGAIYNNSTGSISISGNTTAITSSASSGNATIYLGSSGNSPLSVTDAAVIANGSGYAIYNNGVGLAAISGGAKITAGSNSAIYTTRSGITTVFGNAVVTSANTNANQGTIHLAGGSTLNIFGGVVINTAADRNAVYNNTAGASIVLGNDPSVTGIIRTLPGTLSVIASGSENVFTPAGAKTYVFQLDSWFAGNVAVVDGADHIGKFTAHNITGDFKPVINNGNIIIGLADGYNVAKTGDVYTITRVTNGGEYHTLDLAAAAIRAQCADGCSIQFGSGGDDILDIGLESVRFENISGGAAWGTVTLGGKITSANTSSTQGTITINLAVSGSAAVNINNADITNTAANANGKAIYHSNTRPVKIVGAAVGNTGTGIAIHNANIAPIEISGAAVITSANSGLGTIYLANSGSSPLSITGSFVRNTGSGSAIYNNGTGALTINDTEISAVSGSAIYITRSGALTISGGAVSATAGRAIYNGSTGTITISGNAAVTSSNSSAGQGTIHLANNSTLNIFGGTLSNTAGGANSYAVYVNDNLTASSIILGGDPNITGIIRTLPGTLRAIAPSTAANAFAPAGTKNYTFELTSYPVSAVAVAGGRGFIERFTPRNLNEDLKLVERGDDIIIGVASGYKVTSVSAVPVSYMITRGDGDIPDINVAINEIRADCADGCSIQFGSGGDNVLDVGAENAVFQNITGQTWGTVTLTGKISSSSTVTNHGTITIALGADGNAAVSINADIVNTGGGANGRAIYHSSTRPINITGGKITSSTTSNNGTIYLNSNSPLTVTGATVENINTTSTAGIAIYNNSTGAITISDGAIVTSNFARTNYTNSGTIHLRVNSPLSITNAAVRLNNNDNNNNNSGDYVNAIYNANTGTITVTNSTISAASGNAVNNVSSGALIINGGAISASSSAGRAILNNSAGRVTISGNTEITSANTNASQGTIHLANTSGSNTLEIFGGTIGNTAPNGNAVFNNNAGASIVLGGDPSITGIIRTLSGTLSAVTPNTAENAFAPAAGKTYTFELASYSAGAAAVSGGNGFIGHFTARNIPETFVLIEQGSNIVVSLAGGYKVTEVFGAARSYIITLGDGNISDINTAVNQIRTDCADECFIQFGSGGDNVLNIGTENVLFQNITGETWGTVTLTGRISSSSTAASRGTITIALGVDGDAAVNINADVVNTAGGANGRAIYHSSTRPINITGGRITSSTTNTNGTIYLSSSSPLTITGATVENVNTTSTAGIAIYNNSTGAITISDGAIVTSNFARTNYAHSGTIHLGANSSFNIINAAVRLDNNDNNSNDDYVNAIYNAGNGSTITINGGTIFAERGNAIRSTGGSGTLTINGGAVTAKSGSAVNSSSSGLISISNGAVITSANSNTTAGTVNITNSGNAPLSIIDSKVENSSANGNAIYNNSTGNVIITDAVISANAGSAIFNNRRNKTTISGDKTVISSVNQSAASGTIHLADNGSGTAILEIFGGKLENSVLNESGIVVYCNFDNSSIVLGKSPMMSGVMRPRLEKLSVITTGDSAFTPGTNIYSLNFITYELDAIAVRDGADFRNNFRLVANAFGLAVEGENLVVRNVLYGTARINNVSPRIGDVLTASLTDDNASGNLIYTWRANGEEVGSGDKYTVATVDLGKTIIVEISSDNDVGFVLSTATASVLKKPAPSAPPAAALLSKTSVNITLASVSGYEYRMESGEWQSGAVFGGLTPNTAYTFYQRIAETEDTYASAASVGFDVTTLAVYTVTFWKDEIDGVELKSQIVEHGSSASAPAAPDSVSHNFTGWSAAFGSITADLDVVAEWTIKTYKVTFYASSAVLQEGVGPNGTLTAAVDGTAITSGDMVEHGKAVVFTALSDEGYDLTGWMIMLGDTPVRGHEDHTYTIASLDAAATVAAMFDVKRSALSSGRVVPGNSIDEESVNLQISTLTSEFTVGPNPVARSNGTVGFFRQGKRIKDAALTIYDVSGNAVSKVKIRDAADTLERRQVGSWNLTDMRGRLVSEGTYLLKGTVITFDGKRERVSVVIGVR